MVELATLKTRLLRDVMQAAEPYLVADKRDPQAAQLAASGAVEAFRREHRRVAWETRWQSPDGQPEEMKGKVSDLEISVYDVGESDVVQLRVEWAFRSRKWGTVSL